LKNASSHSDKGDRNSSCVAERDSKCPYLFNTLPFLKHGWSTVTYVKIGPGKEVEF